MSGVAEWSFSMATPFTVKESPFQVMSTMTNDTTTTEDEFECPTTDESVLALRRYVLGNSTKDKERRLSSRMLVKGGMVSAMQGWLSQKCNENLLHAQLLVDENFSCDN